MEDIIQDFKNGKFVILLDAEDRENEGDLVIAAEDITPQLVNFMLVYGKGLICVPMQKTRLEQLKLPLMVEENEEATKCAFTLSVDAKKGVTTGISAVERAHTIKTLADPRTKAEDLARPGHIFPLMAAANGLGERQGHTEAALELCKLAGKRPAAVVCEILNTDGSVATLPQLKEFSEKHAIPLLTIQELMNHA